MKKLRLHDYIRIIGFALLGCFLGGVLYDCYMCYVGRFPYPLSSLHLYIIVRAVVLFVPSVICITVAHFMKRKHIK